MTSPTVAAGQGVAEAYLEVFDPPGDAQQKLRILLALKRLGHVVGFMGDGINDAPALHAADVGISVASAVDVAREAAQVVLLKQDLSVLVQGVREGRRTFANTLKYVFFAIAANFGYMFSLAVASLFLPFLFQAAPAPSAERIAKVVESATRMFLAAYRAKSA